MSNNTVTINGKNLTIEQIKSVARDNFLVAVDESAWGKVKKGREILETRVNQEEKIYGVTTGFGANSQKFISSQAAAQLQINLARSHAAGVGNYASEEVVRATMLIRANLISSGVTGARPVILEKLVELINKNIIPAIPELGSVGSSGDLAPLSYIVLVLMGDWKCFYNGELLATKEAFQKANFVPTDIQAKEGLAIMNGATFMAGIGALAVYDAQELLKVSDIALSSTFEAIRGVTKALDERIATASGFAGQIATAANIRTLIAGSEIVYGPNERIQDAYSIRCSPRILGASRQAVAFARRELETEINGAADNPLMILEDNDIVAGGNFHGQPIALPIDYLKLAVSELGNSSEIRVERMINPAYSEFPAFLVKNPGLESGFMVVQYTQAGLVNMNKSLCWPNSCDSISVCGGQEDHVSMGTNGALNLQKIIYNTQFILAGEIFTACQALDFRKPKNPGVGIKAVYDLVRTKVPFVESDSIMTDGLNIIRDLIKDGTLVEVVEKALKEKLRLFE
jgi:histidine ammonia-lyase